MFDTAEDFIIKMDIEGGALGMMLWGGRNAAEGLDFEAEWQDFVDAAQTLQAALAPVANDMGYEDCIGECCQ